MGLRDVIKDLAASAASTAAGRVQQWAADLGSEDFAKAGDDPGDQRDPTADSKAAGGGAVPTDKDLDVDSPASMLWDPFAIIEQLGYKERPTQITYGTLRAIAFKVPIVQAVVQTRINQVAAFARPQQDRYQLGFQLKLRDKDATPTHADKKWITDATQLVMHTGVHEDPRSRDNFEVFLRKLAWDSLIYDQACAEIVPNRAGSPAQWYAVDASTIRLADTATAYFKKKQREDTKYVQIYDGMIVTEYNEKELCFGVRNPRTDMRLYGYGESELEKMMTAITSILWAWTYNQKFFSQGSAAKGILNFKGPIPEKQLKGFRRHWYTMLTGVENSWRTPITNADELQWVDIQKTNRDMEFNAWMDFLIKVICSLYNMDPVEVNFQYGNTGQKNGLGGQTNNKEKITQSKERGLRPLLRFLETLINRYIIWPMNDNFEFEFVGLDASTLDDVAKVNQMRVKTTRTIDELRLEDGLEPLPDGNGEIILDPTYLQHIQNKQMQEQQAMFGGGEEPPGQEAFGEDGEDEDDEDAGLDFDSMMQEQFGPQQDDMAAGLGKQQKNNAAKPVKPAQPGKAAKSRSNGRGDVLRKGNGRRYRVDIEL